MKRLALLLVVPVLLIIAAWDTRVVEGEAWTSTYFGGQSASLPEHSTLSDMALEQLGVGDLFGLRGTARAVLVDLNASYFRAGALEGSHREGDDRSTLLEERLLPAPSQFSGLPDYSYGPADWFNKNRLCPTGATADDGACFLFTGWMGALNSVHFGTQAERMYARYHRIAVNRAERARRFREAMTPAEQLVHATALREAELQALMYEGYAQHFLQDRWAIGHMWERWNGPDRGQAAHQSVYGGVAVGAVAGLIHGSESVQNKSDVWRGLVSTADPMSSPLPGPDAARPMTFRHITRPDLAPVPAVGDERLADMRTGHFGAHYGDQDADIPLNVAYQRSAMLTCSKAGWAEVIRAFGAGPGGGYGVHNARLRPDAPAFDVLGRATCWDMWATNRSMYVGFVGEGPTGLALLSTLHVKATVSGLGAVPVGYDAILTSDELVALGWRMWRRQWLDPDGTDLARGSIGDLWRARPGQNYQLPSYAEPVEPDDLPATAANGVDRRTIFGAMPLAHSDAWCEPEGVRLLERLRQSDEPANQQMCQYLADLSWQGSHPEYGGRMKRARTAAGAPVRSICHIREGRREASADDPLDPFYLDQGYTSRTEAKDRPPRFGSSSAANWCARAPVIRLSRDPALRDANVIQVLSPSARRVELIGRDFGIMEGDVDIYEEGRQRRGRGRIVDWADNRIQIDFRPGDLAEGRDYLVDIRTLDGRRSVGLFLLRVGREAPDPPPFAAASACDAPPPPSALAFDAGEALRRRLGPGVLDDPKRLAAAMRAVRAEFAARQNAMRVYFLRERACILSRQATGEASIERMIREGRQHAEREARDFYAQSRSRNPDHTPTWIKHCAVGTQGRPIEYRPAYSMRSYRPAGAFWSDHARELDGVIQYGRFAETYMGAIIAALESNGPPLAPDRLALSGQTFDLSLRDPAAVPRRHFRPTGRPAPRPGHVDRAHTAAMILAFETWADGTARLNEATVAGLKRRRAHETWLTSQLRIRAADPLDAYCRVEAGLVRSPAMAVAAPGSDVYRDAGGRPYDRIGWPGPGAIGGQDGPAPGVPGEGVLIRPAPFGGVPRQ